MFAISSLLHLRASLSQTHTVGVTRWRRNVGLASSGNCYSLLSSSSSSNSVISTCIPPSSFADRHQFCPGFILSGLPPASRKRRIWIHHAVTWAVSVMTGDADRLCDRLLSLFSPVSSVQITVRCFNWKALTRGRADQLSNVFIQPWIFDWVLLIVQFPIQVCFSTTVGHPIPSSCWTLGFLLWPWTLTYHLNLRTWPI